MTQDEIPLPSPLLPGIWGSHEKTDSIRLDRTTLVCKYRPGATVRYDRSFRAIDGGPMLFRRQGKIWAGNLEAKDGRIHLSGDEERKTEILDAEALLHIEILGRPVMVSACINEPDPRGEILRLRRHLFGTRSAAAEALDLPFSRFQDIEEGIAKLDKDAEALHIRLRALWDEAFSRRVETAKTPKGSPPGTPQENLHSDPALEMLEVEIVAQEDALIHTGLFKSHGLDPAHCEAIIVPGEQMSPLYRTGAMLVIDKTKRHPPGPKAEAPAAFAFRWGAGLEIAYLTAHSGTILVDFANPACRSKILSQKSLHILGQVMFEVPEEALKPAS